MRRRSWVLALVVASWTGLVLRGDVYEDWELAFEHELPRIFSHADPIGKGGVYWYFVYTVRNPETFEVPLALDISARADDRTHYQNGHYPLVEDQIIEREENLGGFSVGERKEQIAHLKKTRRYLNSSDLRSIRALRPGETIQGLAVFGNVRARLNKLDLLISGLSDPVRYKHDREEGKLWVESKIRFTYENRILVLHYVKGGDEFYPQFKGFRFERQEWVTQSLEPGLSSHELERLLRGLVDRDALRRMVSFGLLRGITNITDPRFQYNPAVPLDENLETLRSMRETIRALPGAAAIQDAAAEIARSRVEELKRKIPPLPDVLVEARDNPGSIKRENVPELLEAVRQVVQQARERKIPVPEGISSALTRTDVGAEELKRWLVGYEEYGGRGKDGKVQKISHWGLKDWDKFIEKRSRLPKGFTVVEGLLECLDSDDSYVRQLAYQLLKEITNVHDARLEVETGLDPQGQDSVVRWQEWWSRNKHRLRFNSETKSYEPGEERK